MNAAYLEGLQSWRHQKEADLRRRDSWLALAGLHWLGEGRQSAGAGPSAALPLPPSSPDLLGDFEVRQGRVFFFPAQKVAVEGVPSDGEPLQPDSSEDPTFLRLGDLTLAVIERGGRLGLRVWDNRQLTTTGFEGRTWYVPDPSLVVEAAFEPASAEATISVPSMTGDFADERLLGTARFAVLNRAGWLRAVPADDRRLWFLFADRTNETTTYPSGRFLVAEPARDGVVILDFNRAYNPPCAFTPFATCPLPPQGNRLPFPIEAGETYPRGHETER